MSDKNNDQDPYDQGVEDTKTINIEDKKNGLGENNIQIVSAELYDLIVEDYKNIKGIHHIDEATKSQLLKNVLTIKQAIETFCPYPDHRGYSEVRISLDPEEQKFMKENISVTPDGKIEVIQMRKIFLPLTAKPNYIDIFDGSYMDKNGRTGTKGVIYLPIEAAQFECLVQGKKLLKNKSEVEKFINLFPGEKFSDKIKNFIKLFGLEKSGYYDCINSKWINTPGCGMVTGYIVLSDIYEYVDGDKTYNCVCAITWTSMTNIINISEKFCSKDISCSVPFIVHEDIILV